MLFRSANQSRRGCQIPRGGEAPIPFRRLTPAQVCGGETGAGRGSGLDGAEGAESASAAKKRGAPWGARSGGSVVLRSEDLIAAVVDTGEPGLMKALGLEDPLADQDEVVHVVPRGGSPVPCCQGMRPALGMNVKEP